MVKTKKGYECLECGKEMKNARSLAGHMWFAHNIRYGEKPNLRREIERLENEPRVSPDVNELIKQANIAQGELAEMMKDLLKMTREINELAHKKNPGDLHIPEKKEEEPDDEDDGLPNLFGDDNRKKIKKTDETDDDDSPFL